MPPDAPKWGSGFKKALAEYFTRTMTMQAHVSCLPVHTNSISLDPTMKDDWGLPALRVTYDSHPDNIKAANFACDRMLELMNAAGARKTWSIPWGEPMPSVHLMGTCRMGNDPAKSVVSADHRAHDVRNLFIVDGSSLVTCGRQQPTATIQALVFRAAERIGKMARAGEV
jgi:choline dehydrogenase-like flavoprotein